MKYDGSEQIGVIVAEFMGASNLMQQHQIDFCCGGQRQLSKVLDQQGIDRESFLNELNQAYEQAQQQDSGRDWRIASYQELIDHIKQAHHAYLLKELPLLSEFTTKLLRVHGSKHPELAKLHRRFHELKLELEQHLVLEEDRVFPSIQQYEQSGSTEALQQAITQIEQLEAEHDHAGALLKEMRNITHQYELPEGACTTFRLTYQKLEQLEADMFQHVHLENNIMFPRLNEEHGTVA